MVIYYKTFDKHFFPSPLRYSITFSSTLLVGALAGEPENLFSFSPKRRPEEWKRRIRNPSSLVGEANGKEWNLMNLIAFNFY
jgi:hypothetical protein